MWLMARRRLFGNMRSIHIAKERFAIYKDLVHYPSEICQVAMAFDIV